MGGTSSQELVETAWYLCYFAPHPVTVLEKTLQQLQQSFDHKTIDQTLKDPRLRGKLTSNFSLLHLACYCAAAPDPQENNGRDRAQFFVNKKEIILFLLETGAFDLNSQDNGFSDTPLQVACQIHSPHSHYALNVFHSNLLEIKNKYQGKVKQEEFSATASSSSKSLLDADDEYRQLLVCLIMEGAKIDSVSGENAHTPLMTASYSLNVVAVNELVAAGARMSYDRSLSNGCNCVHFALYGRRLVRSPRDCLAVLQTLTSIATAFDKVTDAQISPLAVAFEYRLVDETLFLLKNGYNFYKDRDKYFLPNLQTPAILTNLFLYAPIINPSNPNQIFDFRLEPSPRFSQEQLYEIANANSLAAAIILGHFSLFKFLLDSFGYGSLLAEIGPKKVTPFHLLLSGEPDSLYDSVVAVKFVKYIFCREQPENEEGDFARHQELMKVRMQNHAGGSAEEDYNNFIDRCIKTVMIEDDGSKTSIFKMNEVGRKMIEKFKQGEVLAFYDRDSSAVLVAAYHFPLFRRTR